MSLPLFGVLVVTSLMLSVPVFYRATREYRGNNSGTYEKYLNPHGSGTSSEYLRPLLVTAGSVMALTYLPVASTVGLVSLGGFELLSMQAGVLVFYCVVKTGYL